MEKFNLGYDDLRAANPALIYCAIAGYDRYGSEAARAGYDLVVQGESGLMAINGEAERPPVKFGVAAVDLFTGMYAAQAMLAALLEARSSGTGRRIDVALFDCGLSLTAYYGLEALWSASDPPRYGNNHPSIIPYGVFAASDGEVIVAIGNNRQYRQFCSDVLGRPDLAEDTRFATNLLRRENRHALLPDFEAAVGRLTRREVVDRASSFGIPCGEVLGLHQALTNERAMGSEMIIRAQHASGAQAPFFAPPWRLDGERLPVSPPPVLGADTDAVLRAGWKETRSPT
jgi:crotonobetainyl-CoA:carnitine CoA-transferase CaiB-like acyl-CoA transferase